MTARFEWRSPDGKVTPLMPASGTPGVGEYSGNGNSDGGEVTIPRIDQGRPYATYVAGES